MNTKEKILISAKELFENYEYKKVSMDEIASNSNVTKKTIYSYFKDKQSLLNEIVDIELKNIIKKVDKYSSKDITDFIKKTSYYLLKYKNNSKILMKITEERENNNLILKIDKAIIDYIKNKLVILKKEKPNLDFDIDLCSFIIYKVYISIMFEWKNKINEEEVIKNITKILETGLLN